MISPFFTMPESISAMMSAEEDVANAKLCHAKQGWALMVIL
jgi:hypothetical protein